MNTRLLIGISVLALGWLSAICASRSNARNGAPEGTSRHSRGQPFVSQSVLAKGPSPWSTWSLAAYQSFVAIDSTDRTEVSGTLPEGGRLAVTLHHRPADTTSALVITTGESPRGVRMQLDGAGQALNCTGQMNPVAPGPFRLSMARTAQGWAATMAGQTLQCTSPDSVGHPSVTAGLRRVSIDGMSVSKRPLSAPGMQAIGVGIGVSLTGLLGLLGLARLRPRTGVAVALSALIGLPILLIDGARLAEALRLIGARDDWLPLTISLTAMALTLSIGLAASFAARSWRTAVIPTLVFAALVGMVWSVSGIAGWAYTVGFGAVLGGLVWVQMHAVSLKHYNLISLGLTCALIGALEVMVRFSAVGNVWNASNTQQGAGSTATLIEQFEALEAGQYTFYPAKGFPVRLASKQASRRIVCLGASSTGGAFQNDSLNDFYPALLNQLTPEGTEVVNQGVGGWNSFHVRQFIDGHADRLDGEVWTIYLGVNENLPTAMSFSALYDAWKAGDLTERTRALDNIRLFQGLRLLVRGLRPGGGAGVSSDELKDNLGHVIEIAEQRGVNVLLMSEGVRPDPRVLWHYYEVMNELATEHSNASFLDTAAILDRYNDKAFIDTNHLTPNGHTRVARAMDAELRRLGWY